MRINGLSLASTEENVLCGVVYYFCYSHCTCLLLPSVGIKLLALVLSLGCKPFTGREHALVRGTTKVPERFRCLKAEMPWNRFQRGAQVLNSQRFHSGRNTFDGLKYWVHKLLAFKSSKVICSRPSYHQLLPREIAGFVVQGSWETNRPRPCLA